MEDSDRLRQVNDTLTILKLLLENQVSDLHQHIDQVDISKISTFSEEIKVLTDKIIRQLHFKLYLENQIKKEQGLG
jgi:hypothetical protein